MKMHILYLILCLTFICNALSGQQFVDLAKLEYRISPNNVVLDSTNANFNIAYADASALVPLKVDSANYVLAGFAHSTLVLDGDVFQSNTLQVGWQHNWNAAWKSTFLLLPKSSAKRGNLGSGDFQFGGLVIVSKSKSPTFQWKFGAYVNGDKFGPLTVPIFGFKWQASTSLQIDATLPLGATVRKTLNDRLHAGIVYSGRKYSYNANDAYLEVGENNVWGFADVYVTRSLVLNLRAGHSILRDYQFFKNADLVDVSFGSFELGDNRSQLTGSLSQGYSFHAGLIWRINLDK
ncbi:MAG: hypothetical protein GC193_11620 [Cryomorphaceae bacterium]|nr:hypothetical protein [Cryomorphaceae bacterium]